MKKFIVLAIVAVALTIFNGCQKDELVLIDEQPQVVVKPDVYVENGYLAFKNMEAVDSVIQMLGKMKRSEKEVWEQQIGLKSARAEFDKLFNEYDKLESYEEFLAFKKRNSDKLKFNEMEPDDCSIDYPFATGYFLPILNIEGIYKVGRSIIKFTEDNQYVIADGDLNKLNNIEDYLNDKMVYTLPRLKTNEITGLHSFPEDDPKTHNNEWHRKANIDNRKLKNQLYVDRYSVWVDENVWVTGYWVYLNQHGQKISWGNWRDYSTTYGITQIKSQVGSGPIRQDIRTNISAEANPSVNFYLENYQITTTYYIGYLSIPSINFAAKVSFNGFGYDAEDFYQIDNPAGYGIGNTNNYPPSGWGW